MVDGVGSAYLYCQYRAEEQKGGGAGRKAEISENLPGLPYFFLRLYRTKSLKPCTVAIMSSFFLFSISIQFVQQDRADLSSHCCHGSYFQSNKI